MRICPRWMRSLAAVVLALGMWAAPAAAQDKPKKFQEPGIVYAERSAQYIQWIAGALIVAAVMVVAIKNPHRSHLD